MSLLQQDSRKKILLGQDGNSLVILIVFNVLSYIVLSFLKILYLVNHSNEEVFKSQVINWVSVPAQPNVFATRPWTLLSYMFSHFSFWDLFSSMVWLWGFGYILQQLAGNKRVIPIYLYAGLAGSIGFLLSVNLIPALAHNQGEVYSLLGAGPAVTGVAIATTALAPRYRIFPMLKFPLWALTAIFVVIRIGTLGYANYGHIISVVLGGVIGFLFVWQLRKGNDMGQWMSDVVNWFDDLFNPQKKHKKVSTKNQLFYKSNQKPFERTPHVTQQRVDELLDKINYRGYHSLTEEEKEFLKKASKEEL